VISADRFLDEFTRWAEARSDILAVALVGSYVRGSATPESDIDLVILAKDPDSLVRDAAWVARFGPVQSRQVEDYGRVTSVRIRYDGALEVEYGLTGSVWAAVPPDEGTRRTVSGGMRVLLEHDRLLSRLKEHCRDPLAGAS